MRFVDLFAGIGGFSLGLERAGMECVGHVEREPYCQKILKKHWPDVPLMGDVRDVKGNEFGAVDLVCGSPPCQPFSSAGKRTGTGDDRHLWPEMFRIVKAVRPTWTLVENVADFKRVALGEVVPDLESEGYEVQLLLIPACAVGFEHRRDRIWICGYSDRKSQPVCAFDAKASRVSCFGESDRGEIPEADGIPERVARLKALGNAVVPQVVERIGRAILEVEQKRKRKAS